MGEKCMAKGVQFGYHNHEHEFEKFDGEYGLDIIYRNSDPRMVFAEIDTYWAEHAGVDPVEYIKKYSGRCPLIHLKDMEAGEEKFFAEVGNGIMDMKGIVKAAKAAGAKWLIVEQDRCRRPAIESARMSFENLKKMDIAW
jgi:sugar phosphate isomerase/epimerase